MALAQSGGPVTVAQNLRRDSAGFTPQSGEVARAEAGWDGPLHLGAFSILAIFHLLRYCSLAHCHEGRRHSKGISRSAVERPWQTNILLPPVTSPMLETTREHSS
jgi:hypothetical protein